MKAPPGPNTKTRLLETASELLRRQGYSGTGLKQVAAGAGAPWGSLYHHFPEGKEQIAAEAVAHAAILYGTQMRELFERVTDPVAAIGRIFRYEAETLTRSDFSEGCPIAGVALDVASVNDRVRRACSAGFTDWEHIIASLLETAGLPSPKALGLASFALSALEGAIVLSRTHRDTAPLLNSAEAVENAVAHALATAGADVSRSEAVAAF